MNLFGSKTSANDVLQAIYNIFLNRKLPGSEQDSQVGYQILCIFNNFSKSLPEQLQQLNAPSAMLQLDHNIQEQLPKLLKESNQKDVIPVYLEKQNALIFFEKTDDGFVISSSKVQLESTSAIDAPFTRTVPQYSYFVPELDLNAHVLGQMVELNEILFQEAQSKSKKGGNEADETREALKPVLVDEILIPQLLTVEQKPFENTNQVEFLYEDEIRWNMASTPFRRQGYYLALLMTLHYECKKKFGELGDLYFKLIEVLFMSGFCQYTVEIEGNILFDVMKITQSKLKHVERLMQNKNESTDFAEETICRILEQVKTLNESLEKKWENTIQAEIKQTQVEKMDLFNETHTVIDINEQILQYNLASKASSVPSINIENKYPFDYIDTSSISIPTFKNYEKAAMYNHLFQHQEWVFNSFEKYVNTTTDHSKVRKYFENFYDMHKQFFTVDNNVIQISRMLLACSYMISIYDKYCCKQTPLLKLYRCPQQIESFNTKLCLKTNEEVKILDQIVEYITERNTQSQYSSTIISSTIESSSFSVKFAVNNVNMQCYINELLREDERNVQSKLREFRTMKEQYNNLIQRANQMEHGIYTNYYKGFSAHDRYCRKCALNREAESMSIKAYEHNLPDSSSYRNAIAFEKLAPQHLIMLREMQTIFNNSKVDQNKYQWQNMLAISNNQQKMVLCSDYKQYSNSHYSNIKMSYSQETDCIVNNACNCIFQQNTCPDYGQLITIKLPQNSLFKSLEFTINSTQHFENQIIAMQDKCPCELNKPEFLEFGLLRSGESIQLQNLFRIIKGETLCLNNFEVFYLIQMTMNQVGSIVDGQRPAMLDYNNEDFILEMLLAIKDKINSLQNNWTYNITLLNLTQIVVKIANYTQQNSSIKNEIYNILTKIININHTWTLEIQKQYTMQQSVQLLNITSSTLMCFQIDLQNYNQFLSKDFVFKQQTALKVLFDSMQLQKSGNNQNQLIINENFKVMRTINCLLGEQKVMDSLNMLLTSQWQSTSIFKTEQWKVYSQNQNILYYVQGDTLIQFDIQFGQLLINGEPQSQLPLNITNHMNYKQLFVYDNVICNKCGLNKYSFKEHDKTFILKQNKNELFITCNYSADESYLLIPKQIIQNSQIPNTLIDSYNHWYNETTQEILFSGENILDSEYTYKMQSKQIIKTKQQHLKIINMSLNISQKALNYFQCIEKDIFSIIIYNTEQQVGFIELTRPQLRFLLTKDGFQSIEYENFYVNDCQQIGIFVGLQQKLLLKHKYSNEYIYIVPYGQIKYNKNKDQIILQIDLSYAQSKKVFSIRFNPLFNSIQSEQSLIAQLYLTLICALTSNYMADPFTGVSGVEQAIKILKQKCCEGTEPLDTEQLQILLQLQNLSPKRKYYPQHLKVMQQVDYDTQLFEHQQSDIFKLLVKVIMQNRQQHVYLFDQQKAINPNQISELDYLCEKYSQKYCVFYSELSNNYLQINKPSSPSNLKTKIIQTMQIINCKQILTDGTINSLQSCSFIDTYEKIKQIGVIFNEQVDLITLQSQYVEIKSFFEKWIQIYQSIVTNKVSKEELLSFYSVGLLQNIDQSYLNQLLLVYKNYKDFPQIPEHQSYDDIDQTSFNSSFITKMLESLCLEFDDYKQLYTFTGTAYKSINMYTYRHEPTQEYVDWLNNLAQMHKNAKYKQTLELTQIIKECWPDNLINIKSITYNQDVLKFQKQQEVFQLVNKWKKNLDLFQFFKKLVAIQEQLENTLIVPKIIEYFTSYQSNYTTTTQSTTKIQYFQPYIFQYKQQNHDNIMYLQTQEVPFPLSQLENNYISEIYFEELKQSWNLYHTNVTSIQQDKNFNADIIKQQYIKEIQLQQQLFNKLWQEYRHQILLQNPIDFNLPISLYYELQILSQYNYQDSNRFQQMLDIAVVLTYLQRAQRIIKYIDSGSQFYIFAQQESEEQGYTNWNPLDHPLWVLLQIQCDCMIRQKQVEVALEMMNPKTNSNSVMQLNMGEGKTCIIIPMIALELSNKKQLCRLIVLRQVFHVNYIQLKFKLGQLLCRSVMFTPFNRQAQFSTQNIAYLQQFYENCLNQNTVLISQPEYISSYKLKVQESTQNHYNLASSLFQQQKWLDDNIRDILDESDEILSHKYQMIYTIGNQVNITGGNNRWLLIEQVLQTVLKIAEKFASDYSENSIFIKHQSQSQYQFMEFRFINDKANQAFIELIAKEILKGDTEIVFPLDLTSDMLLQIQTFLTGDITEEQHKNTIQLLQEYNCENIFLQLKGLLKLQVLSQALTKRWSVNYGVSKTNGKQMAVPFKAKDVASDRTEFGHVDTALTLTLLSYYYTGLTYNMVMKVLQDVESLEDPEAIYSTFIIGSQIDGVPVQFRQFKGINLKDEHQLEKCVYPVLKYNTRVINFWVNNNVFNKETKQFPQKLTTGAPQLCEERDLLTTGFSGTNDTKLLLPQSIQQNDLDILKQTNGEILFRMLKPENDHYYNIQNENVSQQVIELAIKINCKVILDVGAVMIEMNNLQIARKWLSLINDENIRAAIYINERNQIMVVDHHDNEIELILSPFANNLGACIIYIDDIHTRGTDFKIPLNTKACVTLGMGVTKDKLVQGCMRMRQLGKGHSVNFVAVSDVNTQIQHLFENQRIGVNQVMQWACNNSINVLKTGLVHWIWMQFHFIEKKYLDQVIDADIMYIQQVGEYFADDDVQELMHLYGQYMSNINVKEMGQRILQIFLTKIKQLKEKFQFEFTFDYSAIIDKTDEYGKDIFGSIQNLDEQQEREIELEVEVEAELEVQKQRASVTPKQNVVDPNLVKAVNGDFYQFSLLSSYMKQTTLLSRRNVPHTADIFVTTDFMRVSEYGSQLLKPVRWLLLVNDCVIIMSQFEANSLRKLIQKQKLCKLIPFQGKYKVTQKNIHTVQKIHIPQLKFNLETHQEQLISAFAGNLFFENEAEQNNFCKTLGFLPQPRTAEQQLLVNKGKVTRGFCANQTCNVNAGEMIFTLSGHFWECEVRFSHLFRIVEKGLKVQFE
ncbi:Conserved_hypothetical protein [Hexamita inflata]|uniref:ubiquitinyl hydrolase 1 n=1 Tax=Hexamita inflata TaxID=28002 RepID=A0AA86PC18_9EUKA|nr:Conserved hypothetical protein [Hexamita inflata]